MKDSASARICREIRERIVAGTLRPGDRAPSARQIKKEWKVAIATATKVLKQLRDDGLVRALPGIGTVVLPPPAHVRIDPRARAQELTRESIVACAIAIADRQGLAALSMRAVAAELGVATMSLYRHVPGKDDLVVLMADAAFAEAVVPRSPPKGWRVRLELLARLHWWLAVRHPWLPHVLSFTRPQLIPNGMAHTDWSMRALEDTGLDVPTCLLITITLFAHVRAHALDLETERQAALDSGMTVDEWFATQSQAFDAIVAARSLSALSRVPHSPDASVDPESLFQFGLQRLLDGIAVLIKRR